ncbi:protein-disulfide reductase DsbD [Vibrio tapetis]|nr:protein-disulfide reductase DsbD [Vibrio tapetis]
MRSIFSVLIIAMITWSSPSWALFGNNDQPSFTPDSNQFVTVSEAFPFNFIQHSDKVELDWQVKEGYYLYQDKISISASGATIDSIEMRDGKPYQDEFFGKVQIYTTPLLATVSLSDVAENGELTVRYQGCAKAGFCYPPEIIKVPLSLIGNGESLSTEKQQVAKPAQQGKQSSTQLNDDNNKQSRPLQTDTFTDKLANNWWTPLLFFGLGIGLAFTPCVLPMYPILTSIVLGSGKLNHRRALTLSFIYVQGMALTYTLLGLVVASAGLQFQAAMQHPYVLVGLSVLFVVLALSMFGVYTLQLPSTLQTKLNQLSNQQQGGNNAGVFAMGAISGLVCSPCTTAPLSGALLYVAQSGDMLTGGVALYALAIGMGVPLIAVAVFGNKLLPKAGGWMDKVKIVFGFILLAAPIFLLERILPELWSQMLWSALGLVAFGWLYHAKNPLPFGGWKQSVIGIVAVLGLVASSLPILNHWIAPPKASHQVAQPQFIRVNNIAELEAELLRAKQVGKPVMLDFYADWCVACKEFEKYTFHDEKVSLKLADFILLQADVTKNQSQDIQLLKELKVLGLPTIDFWDANGNYMAEKRLTGFMKAEPFLEHINTF